MRSPCETDLPNAPPFNCDVVPGFSSRHCSPGTHSRLETNGLPSHPILLRWEKSVYGSPLNHGDGAKLEKSWGGRCGPCTGVDGVRFFPRMSRSRDDGKVCGAHSSLINTVQPRGHSRRTSSKMPESPAVNRWRHYPELSKIPRDSTNTPRSYPDTNKGSRPTCLPCLPTNVDHGLGNSVSLAPKIANEESSRHPQVSGPAQATFSHWPNTCRTATCHHRDEPKAAQTATPLEANARRHFSLGNP